MVVPPSANGFRARMSLKSAVASAPVGDQLRCRRLAVPGSIWDGFFSWRTESWTTSMFGETGSRGSTLKPLVSTDVGEVAVVVNLGLSHTKKMSSLWLIPSRELAGPGMMMLLLSDFSMESATLNAELSEAFWVKLLDVEIALRSVVPVLVSETSDLKDELNDSLLPNVVLLP